MYPKFFYLSRAIVKSFATEMPTRGANFKNACKTGGPASPVMVAYAGRPSWICGALRCISPISADDRREVDYHRALGKARSTADVSPPA